MAFEGETIDNPRQLTGNAALMRVSAETIPAAGVRDWFDTLLHAGLPHHVALFQGRHREFPPIHANDGRRMDRLKRVLRGRA